MNMSILPALPGFALAFILIFCYEYRIKLIKTKSKNKVHFYVARDKYQDKLYIFLGKPVRGTETWYSYLYGTRLFDVSYFKFYGLKLKDFQNLKWEDEPVEVFLNIEN